MYSNIDLDHGRLIVQLWLESLEQESSHFIPTKADLYALELVMRNSIIAFEKLISYS